MMSDPLNSTVYYDPFDSMADLLKALEAVEDSKKSGTRAERFSCRGGSHNDDDCDKENHHNNISTPQNKYHLRQHTPKRHEYPQSESSWAETSEDEASEVGSDADEEEEIEVGNDADDEEEFKINKIIACKSMTLKEWKDVCSKMNTNEITNGSRWIQEKELDGADLEKCEQRFLVKWDGLSFLHCSWETKTDLVELCEGAKGRLSTFFRKAEGGLLYDVDERLDGVSL